MKKFKVRTRYTSEDIYEVIANSAEKAGQMVIENYDYISVETDEERAFVNEEVISVEEVT